MGYGRLFLLPLLLAFNINLVYGQKINRAYDFGYSNAGLDLTIVSDGYLIAATGENPKQVYLITKVDTAGIILWQQSLTNTKEGYYPVYIDALKVDQFENIYGCGSQFDTTYSENLLVFKLNKDGDSLWVRHIDSSTLALVWSLGLDTINHRIYAFGTESVNSNSGLNDSRSILWTLDTNGNTLSLTYYPTNYFGLYSGYVNGDTLFVGALTVDSGKGYEPSIVKLDSTGSILQINTYGTERDDLIASFEENAFGYLLVSELDTLSSTNTSAISQIDHNMNVVWQTFFDEKYKVRRAKTQPDGSVIFIGWTGGYTSFGLVGKLDTNGDLLWSRNYRHSDTIIHLQSDQFYDFDIDTITGDIVLVGDCFRYNQDVWLLRVDSLGCLVPGCDTISEPPTGIIENAISNHFAVYPNPSNGLVYVSANGKPGSSVEVRIVNVLGQTVKSEVSIYNDYGFAEITMDIHDVEAGIYSVFLEDNNGNLKSKRLVVQQ